MKKRIARSVVYFGLTCLTALVLSHPYIWQSIFGPKIKGEPLWAWQQEIRARCHEIPGNPTLLAKVLQILKIDSRPLRWIGSFDSSDPELLPVLFSLADDGDEMVRCQVGCSFGAILSEKAAVTALVNMLDDRSTIVQDMAFSRLRQSFIRRELVTHKDLALLKLRELLRHPNQDIQIKAALSLALAGECPPESRMIVRECARSPLPSIRCKVYELSDAFNDDDELFNILVNNSKTEPGFIERVYCVRSLHIFGKKAIPQLMLVLGDAGRRGERGFAVSALGSIGPDATVAIPTLEILLNDPDPNLRRIAALALQQIDPERAAKI
jgi:hypothetical protein